MNWHVVAIWAGVLILLGSNYGAQGVGVGFLAWGFFEAAITALVAVCKKK